MYRLAFFITDCNLNGLSGLSWVSYVKGWVFAIQSFYNQRTSFVRLYGEFFMFELARLVKNNLPDFLFLVIDIVQTKCVRALRVGQ